MSFSEVMVHHVVPGGGDPDASGAGRASRRGEAAQTAQLSRVRARPRLVHTQMVLYYVPAINKVGTCVRLSLFWVPDTCVCWAFCPRLLPVVLQVVPRVEGKPVELVSDSVVPRVSYSYLYR